MTYPGQQPPQSGAGVPGYGAPQQPGYGGRPGYGPSPGYPGQYGQPGPYGRPVPPYGYAPQPPGQWAPRPVNNVPAAIVLVLGGLAGLLQFFLPWFSVRGQSLTGLDVAKVAGVAGDIGSSSGTIIQIGVYLVLIGGALVLIAGAVLFVPMRGKRIVGALALVVSLVMVVGMIFWLTSGEPDPDSTGPGYYFFLAAGGIGVVGSIIAMVKR